MELPLVALTDSVAATARDTASMVPPRVAVTWTAPVVASTGLTVPLDRIPASTVLRSTLRAKVVATATDVDLPVPTANEAAAEMTSAWISDVSSAVTAMLPASV